MEPWPVDFSTRYNRIRSIEEQSCLSQQTLTDTILRLLAGIYVEFEAHAHFVITLLHTHNDVPPGYAMVHTRKGPYEDICNMEQLGSRRYPCAYHWVAGQFLPYEYSTNPTPTPAENFCLELGKFLDQNQLGDIIAISCVSSFEGTWMERLAADGIGTVATRITHDLDPYCPDYVITEWSVRSNGAGFEVKASKACQKPEKNDVGGHKRI